MAAPIKPRKHTSLKKDAWWLVPAIADTSEPTVAEVNAAGGIYATCFLLQDQGGVQKTVNKTQLAALLCEDSTSEVRTPANFTMSDIVGVFDPQAAADDPDKALFEFLRNGFVGFAVRRQNVVNDTDDGVTAGQFVDVVAVDIDDAWPDKSAAGPEGFYTFTSGVAVTATPVANVAVVTGA
jgi:hypothetical protein